MQEVRKRQTDRVPIVIGESGHGFPLLALLLLNHKKTDHSE